MKFKKADLYLILGLIVLAAIGGIWFALNKKEGAEVVVTVDQKEYARLPLSEDAVLEILSEGDGRNYLVIKDGVAKVTEANCPDQICVKDYYRGIRYHGETIICLPHRMVVSIEGGEENPAGIDN